jgi:DNA repair exonuclease SbcCD ATPase subunit
MPGDMKPRRQPLLAHLLVKQGLITHDQLREALRAQAEAKEPVSLEQVLIERKLVTPAQLNGVLESYHKRFRLGSVLMEMKLLSEEQLRLALQHQQKTGVRLGDALLKLNLVTERQLRQALCRQFDVELVDLDKVSIEPELTQLFGKPYAQQHRVIPLAREGTRLTVAMDDPGDLDVIEDLAAFTGCEIEVVISTLAAFQRAFLRAYGESPPAAPMEPAPLSGAGSADAQALARLREEHEAVLREREGEMQAAHELAARHAETLQALEELRAAHDALRAEADARARAFEQLEAQDAVTRRTLEELRAAHDGLQAERESRAAAFQELEAWHGETLRSLEELRAAHDALRAEGGQVLQELQGRHTRLLAALKAAQDAVGEAQAEGARARQEWETRQAETARALEELRSVHDALVEEREATAQRFRELATRTLAELEAAQDTLRQERARAAQALRELEALRKTAAASLPHRPR